MKQQRPEPKALVGLLPPMTQNQNDPIGQMQAAMRFFTEMQKPAQEAMKLFGDTQMNFSPIRRDLRKRR